MNNRDLFSSARIALGENGVRSVLTTLGIVIGVGSVVLMLSVGSSLERYILSQVESFGGNTIDVYPTGLEKFGRTLESVTEDDYEAIASLETVTNVAPVIFVTESVRSGTEEVRPMVFGTTPEIFGNYGLEIARGRLLSDRDIRGARPVAVLAHETANDLFESRDPIGASVTIGNRSFEVVGILESVGSLVLQDLDTPVFVPYTVAKSMTGKKFLDYITLQSTASDALARADITSLLRQRHRIENPDDDPDNDDFMVRSVAQATGVLNTVSLGLTVFLGLTAGVSLVVGGIGIMNIMLVSVTQRRREIGLRKALGARRRDILLQFLCEAVLLTTIGGAIGIMGSVGLTVLLTGIADRYLGEFPVHISVPALLLALTMAAGTGVIFGLQPARGAANLPPVDALRKS